MNDNPVLSRRAAALALLVLPAFWSRSAAAFPVIDVANIAQVAKQIQETLRQIETTRQQVRLLENAARQLNPSNYRGIQALLTGNGVKFTELTRDVSTIGFTLERVNTQFARIFPNEDGVKKMRPKDYEATSRGMHDELYATALVSARAQTTLTSIEANDREAKNILERSEGNDSQLAQLQSAIQMLGLLHHNLVGITQTVNAAGRLSSDLAAEAVTERRMDQERKNRLMRDYTKSSPSPGIDRRFLEPK